MRDKIITYVLLVAILVVGIIQLFAGRTGAIVGTDFSNTSVTDANAIITGTLAVTGATTLTGGVSGVLTSGRFTQGGTATTISTTSATYTLTAAELGASSVIKFTPLGAITTVTLPATSTLFASYLTGGAGDFIDVNYFSVGTSTVLAAGAGGTLGYTSSTTVAAGKYGVLRIIRDSTLTYKAWLLNVAN